MFLRYKKEIPVFSLVSFKILHELKTRTWSFLGDGIVLGIELDIRPQKKNSTRHNSHLNGTSIFSEIPH